MMVACGAAARLVRERRSDARFGGSPLVHSSHILQAFGDLTQVDQLIGIVGLTRIGVRVLVVAMVVATLAALASRTARTG